MFITGNAINRKKQYGSIHPYCFFVFNTIIFYFDLESAVTTGATGGVLAFPTGKAKHGMAFGTSTENVGNSIRGTVLPSSSEKLGFQIKKLLVFPTSLFNVARQATEQGPDKQRERNEIHEKGQIGENVGYHTEGGEHDTKKQQNDLYNEEKIV